MTIGEPDTLPSGEYGDATFDDTNAAPIDGVDSSMIGGSQSDLVAQAGDLIFFETDQHSLTMQARNVLDAQAQWLTMYPNVNVVIEGHADERGTREYNLALGERRAISTKNYLIAMGIDPRRIETVSYGKEQPLVIGSDGQSWAQNRRARTRVQ
jgi:peptidoglycan-associated lipoprotein